MKKITYAGVRLLLGLSMAAYHFRGLFFALILVIMTTLAIWNPLAGVSLATILCPTRGKEVLVDLCLLNSPEPKFIHWGTGAGAAGAGSVGLSSPSAEEARTDGTSSKVTTTTANDTYQVVGTITDLTSGKTITNAGLFDDLTAGNLFVVVDGMSQAVAVGDGIAFTFKNKFVSA